MTEADSVPLRGRRRQHFARQLAARYTHHPVPICELAAAVRRRPSLVRRLLEEAGIQVGGGGHDHRRGVAAELADRYAAGDSLETLARDTGIDRRVVRGLLTGAGVAIRERRPLPADQGQWVVDQYRSGTTLRGLAERTGCSYATVRRYLLRAGVHLRPPGGRR